MTVHLGGGGTAQQEAAVWRRMLSGRPRVLSWPFALEARRLDDAEAWLISSLEEFQPGLDVVTWTTLDGRSPEDMTGSDLLLIGGGNTFDLLAHLRAHGALEWVRAFLEGGGDLYGGSAGAILAGATTSIAAWHDENTTALTSPGDLAGLGLLPGRAVLPHYTEDGEQRAREWAAAHHLEVLGVPETAGLVIEDGEVVVVGADPVWRLTDRGATALHDGGTFAAAGPGC